VTIGRAVVSERVSDRRALPTPPETSFVSPSKRRKTRLPFRIEGPLVHVAHRVRGAHQPVEAIVFVGGSGEFKGWRVQTLDVMSFQALRV